MGNQLSGIQALIDKYDANITTKYPDVQIGVVIGFVTPATPAGAVAVSTASMTSQAGDTITLSGSTPFELGSVSKLFTTGIYDELSSMPGFTGTLGDMLGSMTLSSTVAAIPIECLAAYSSGFPQDNGDCPLHSCTNIPNGTAATLVSLFEFLSTYKSLPYAPGTMYAYSNLAVSLLAMAALNLDSTNTDDFATAYNNALVKYCQTFGVDPTKSTPTTVVYNQMDAGTLPVGYDKDFNKKIAPPCSIPEYGSGGIVSTGSDMLNFLLFAMSTNYPAFTQEYRWQNKQYCIANKSGPIVGYGWFLFNQTIKGQPIQVVSKDGAVAGFTSWIGLEQRPFLRANAPRGVFVLTNGPDAVALGTQAFNYLIPPTSTSSENDVLDIPALSGDAAVH